MHFLSSRFGADLYAKRSAARLGVYDMEAECGISGPTISRIETGQSTPTLDTFCKLLEWMNELPNRYIVRE